MEQSHFPISKQIKAYVERKPFIIEALERDIINYSALSREICKDLNIKNVDTAKAALIRIGIKQRKIKRNTEQKAIEILREANVSVKNRIATLHHSSFIEIDTIAYSKTPSGYLFFIEENIARKSRYKNIEYGFAIVQIKSSKEIEKTPGAIVFILSALASEGINIAHVMGCREDTFIVVKEYDAPIAFRTLMQRLMV